MRAWPLAAAMLGLGQVPAADPADAHVILASLCGSNQTTQRVPIRIPTRPDGHDRRCPMACHVARIGRRQTPGCDFPDESDAPDGLEI